MADAVATAGEFVAKDKIRAFCSGLSNEGQSIAVTEVEFDTGAYKAGGIPVDLSVLGFKSIVAVIPLAAVTSGGTAYYPQYVYDAGKTAAGGKIALFEQTPTSATATCPLAECTAGVLTDMSTLTVALLVIGS